MQFERVGQTMQCHAQGAMGEKRETSKVAMPCLKDQSSAEEDHGRAEHGERSHGERGSGTVSGGSSRTTSSSRVSTLRTSSSRAVGERCSRREARASHTPALAGQTTRLAGRDDASRSRQGTRSGAARCLAAAATTARRGGFVVDGLDTDLVALVADPLVVQVAESTAHAAPPACA